MSQYVLATDPDEVERRRMDLLFAYHGELTIDVLRSTGIGSGWRCLEVGAGGGRITSWMAEQVGPRGAVTAVDLETRWVEPLAGDVISVRRGDFTRLDLPVGGFDLVVAQMLLLHLPDPAAGCRRFVELTAPGGQIVIHDADFTPVAFGDATEAEAAGLAAMADVMVTAGVDVALGPRVASLLEAAGATVEQVVESPCTTAADMAAMQEITAITLERFRDRATAPPEALDAALAALADDQRPVTGPTRWVVRARVSG